ncbi:uncharacterized protein DS421_11g335180 [Arachis hypogaea]|nr:uncharacterized protein DS421_11g335180 [Arachis hypogaea]
MATMKEKAHYNKTHYCRCQTKAISTVYREMSQEKKDIVEEMGFGALANVLEMNVSNTLLKELLDRFDEERRCLKTLQGRIYITPQKVAAAFGITNGEKIFPGKVDYNNLNPADKECAGYECRRGGEPKKNSRGLLLSSYKSASCSPQQTEQEKDNTSERRKRALEMIREKRSKKRNDGAQSANIAPNQFESPKAQNEVSQTVPTVNLDNEQLLQTQGSSTPSVNTASNTRPPLALSLPSSVQEELMKDDFIYVPPQKETQQTSNNDCPQEAEKQGVTVSLTSSVIEDLFKDDYVYEVSNEDPTKEQQQQAQEPPVQQQSEQEALVNVRPLEQQQQPCEEPTAQQSEQEAPVDVSVIEEFFKDADVYEVSDEEQSKEPRVARQSEKETLILSSFDSAAQPRKRENERPFFSLGISPPASQPSHPSQESVSQLEILAEAVVDVGVTAALKFAEGTSSEPTLPVAQVYKTPQKKTKITNELVEKCYHWMTHMKQTKDGTNEYEPVFVLKHEALYEGLREYFMFLMPEEQVHAVVVSIHSMILNEIKTKRYQEQIYIVPLDIVNFMLGTHGVEYTDKRTNKAYRFDIEQYAHHRQFLDKRKLASHPFLFVPIFNGGHWWLWIADVNKKKFYVLDLINKLSENIADSRKQLNKFFDLIISQMRVYAGAEPLMEDGLGEEAEYIQLNGQRTK